MEDTVDLGTFAELGVALVGFAALIAVFRGGSINSWHPRARLAFWYITSQGLGALFFALLPSILAVLRLVSWRGALATVGLFHGVSSGVLVWRHLRLLREHIPTPNTWFYWIIGVVAVTNVVVLVSGAFGWLERPPQTLYNFGVASCLLLSGLAFVGVLRIREPAA